ncbi:non-SMC mitotic condensation complex subunit 1-domain-containing protein [Thamnidium elegans]|nr:non-SMC mitotic condensation complex subunit 1-domain-containing protein [Thamnidium elegans]
MLDPTAHTRQKVLQVYIRLFELKFKFPKRRHAAAVLAIRHLQDKSSLVRKYAIRLLTVLLSTHPFSLYGGELNLEEWIIRSTTLKAEIENVTTEENAAASFNSATQDAEMTEQDQTEEPSTPSTPLPTEPPAPKVTVSAEKLQQLILMRTFHLDAIRFIEQIHHGIPTIAQLLSSKSKAEVLESMDFLVTAYNYKVKLAGDGIKKMLHLIWTKDTSDEGKGIKMKLLSCYKSLYLEKDGKLSQRENIARIAKNLIELTNDTTLAELTSLEQVLSTLMNENDISHGVIEKLWSVYGFTKGRIQKSQRRGAIIILGMLAKAQTTIVSDKIDVMLKFGLGPLGKSDLSLAKYTCIALQRLEGVKTKEKGRGVQEGIRFPLKHPVFLRLKDIIENPTTSTEWFSLAEQAINTVYVLCENPETLSEEIIKDKTAKVFGLSEACSDSIADMDPPSEAMVLDYDLSLSQQISSTLRTPVYQKSNELSQLLFLVGHVALKQTVHLEIIEAAWKRKKTKKEIEERKSEIEDELEQVGGTTEDDIGDAMIRIREREILFGQNSLLGRFGPLLTEVCARNKVYTDRTLQVTATLALAKFMCNATIRSNIVIALGDMAVCFSTLIDDNITFLYNRLSDTDVIVRKNTVMVLTHLILNGMIKVKGQISEMAKCVEDTDQRIVDLAKLFFTELASKDNAIYNNLPDIISNLTSSQPVRLEEESFRRIMKFIFSFDFTEKEKQAENIIDKLCLRFSTAQDERNWRDIAYCLSLLPFRSEKSFKKLLDGWSYYQDKIHEDAVHKSFLEIITKGRFHKNQKPELKALVDEFEQKVDKQKGPELVEKPEKTTKKARNSAKLNEKNTSEKNVTPKKRDLRKRKRTIDFDSEDSDTDIDMDELSVKSDSDTDDDDDEEEKNEDEEEEEEEEEGSDEAEDDD